MTITWAKSKRSIARVTWIGSVNGREVFGIWQHVVIRNGKRSMVFRLFRLDGDVVGDFRTLAAAKANAEGPL